MPALITARSERNSHCGPRFATTISSGVSAQDTSTTNVCTKNVATIGVEGRVATEGESVPPNRLYYGDNLGVLRKFIRDETVDLCYIDPPFNSKRDYNYVYKNIGEDVHA